MASTDNRFVLLQLSDPHVGARWNGVDSVARLTSVVESVRALHDSPDAVLVTGDLAENAAHAEYDEVRGLLSQLGAPLYVVPGNHDDRGRLRRAFDLPGTGADPVQYTAELGPLRLVAIDSTRPPEAEGELDGGRLAWLDATLAASPDAPTVVAMHHPPILTGLPAFDAIGLPAADRRAFAEVIGRHPQVRRIVVGHVHRAIDSTLANRAVLVAPSTYLQAELDLQSEEIRFGNDPPGVVVHAFFEDELVSHVQFLR